MLNIDLANRTTVVIGGSRGIGASIVRLAARAGSNVAWTYLGTEKDTEASRHLSASLESCGVKLYHSSIDCTNAAATREFVKEVVRKCGGLDNLVYCAGFTSPVAFLDLTEEEWIKTVDINLTGAFLAVHSAIPYIKERHAGSIVLIGSAAIVSGGGGRADYVSAKAGLEGLNRAITKEFAPHGIRCNLVHPSLIETDLLRQRHPDEAKRASLARTVPIRRLGSPEDIANLAAFLLSDLSGYITGQSVIVDGGRTYCS